jgi:ferric-dicitrate binding protein FerR (iron transport regulator)
MRLDKVNIEEILERALRVPTHQQIEAARARVYARLRFERQRGTVTPIQQSDARASRWWRPVIATAAAAALIALGISVGIPLRDRGPYAVLEAADSSMYRISDGNRIPIRVGARIAAQEMLRSNGGSGAVLALEDGSRIEIGSKSELWWDRADEGLVVRLNTGSIIISAAKEATGRLYVRTKDMTASIARTTSLVNAEDDGSSVAVIEGEAQVREGTVEKTLQSGQRLSTSPTLATRPLPEAIAWSRNADSHLRILAAFSNGMATTTGSLTSVNGTAGGHIDSGQRPRAGGPAFERPPSSCAIPVLFSQHHREDAAAEPAAFR